MAQGPNGIDGRTRHTTLEDIDATFRWKPLQQAPLPLASSCGASSSAAGASSSDGTQTARGWFVSGEYQLAKRWFAGARYEESDHADDATLATRARPLT